MWHILLIFNMFFPSIAQSVNLVFNQILVNYIEGFPVSLMTPPDRPQCCTLYPAHQVSIQLLKLRETLQHLRASISTNINRYNQTSEFSIPSIGCYCVLLIYFLILIRALYVYLTHHRIKFSL